LAATETLSVKRSRSHRGLTSLTLVWSRMPLKLRPEWSCTASARPLWWTDRALLSLAARPRAPSQPTLAPPTTVALAHPCTAQELQAMAAEPPCMAAKHLCMTRAVAPRTTVTKPRRMVRMDHAHRDAVEPGIQPSPTPPRPTGTTTTIPSMTRLPVPITIQAHLVDIHRRARVLPTHQRCTTPRRDFRRINRRPRPQEDINVGSTLIL
jgi:hypothetical protein